MREGERERDRRRGSKWRRQRKGVREGSGRIKREQQNNEQEKWFGVTDGGDREWNRRGQ